MQDQIRLLIGISPHWENQATVVTGDERKRGAMLPQNFSEIDWESFDFSNDSSDIQELITRAGEVPPWLFKQLVEEGVIEGMDGATLALVVEPGITNIRSKLLLLQETIDSYSSWPEPHGDWYTEHLELVWKVEEIVRELKLSRTELTELVVEFSSMEEMWGEFPVTLTALLMNQPVGPKELASIFSTFFSFWDKDLNGSLIEASVRTWEAVPTPPIEIYENEMVDKAPLMLLACLNDFATDEEVDGILKLTLNKKFEHFSSLFWECFLAVIDKKWKLRPEGVWESFFSENLTVENLNINEAKVFKFLSFYWQNFEALYLSNARYEYIIEDLDYQDYVGGKLLNQLFAHKETPSLIKLEIKSQLEALGEG